MPAANRVVKFVGGPCDGLECRDDSLDRFEASIAIVWSLFRIGCGGPLTSPEMLQRRQGARPGKPGTVAPSTDEADGVSGAHYRVIRRSLLSGNLVSVAWHAPPQHNQS